MNWLLENLTTPEDYIIQSLKWKMEIISELKFYVQKKVFRMKAKWNVFKMCVCICIYIYSFSVTKSCLTLCDPMNCSMLGFPVLHHLLEFAQSHVHWVSDAIQSSHPVAPFFSCSKSLLASVSFPMSWLFASGGQSIGASAKHQSFQEYSGLISFRIDWFDLRAVQGDQTSQYIIYVYTHTHTHTHTHNIYYTRMHVGSVASVMSDSLRLCGL